MAEAPPIETAPIAAAASKVIVMFFMVKISSRLSWGCHNRFVGSIFAEASI
jgi:hypothetical protein